MTIEQIEKEFLNIGETKMNNNSNKKIDPEKEGLGMTGDRDGWSLEKATFTKLRN